MRRVSLPGTSTLRKWTAPIRNSRPLAVYVVVGLAVLLVTGGWCWSSMLTAPPSRAEADEIVFGNDLVAYEVWDDRPRVVFRDSGKLRYDYLWADPISIEFPPLPRWQLSGHWYSMPLTSEAASIGVVACLDACSQATVLFGELRDVRIVALEVQYAGASQRFEMKSEGYLVRLDGFTGVPDAYRWLDAAGATVYEGGRVEPLTY